MINRQFYFDKFAELKFLKFFLLFVSFFLPLGGIERYSAIIYFLLTSGHCERSEIRLTHGNSDANGKDKSASIPA